MILPWRFPCARLLRKACGHMLEFFSEVRFRLIFLEFLHLSYFYEKQIGGIGAGGADAVFSNEGSSVPLDQPV